MESAELGAAKSPAQQSAPVSSAKSHPERSSEVATSTRAPAAVASRTAAAAIPVEPVTIMVLPWQSGMILNVAEPSRLGRRGGSRELLLITDCLPCLPAAT